MPGHSSKTIAVALRLDNKVYGVVERRAGKRGVKISQYLKDLISYDSLRKR